MTKPYRRLPAEWEPQSAIQLTFPHLQSDWAYLYDEVLPLFVHIAETIAQHQKVLVVCQDKATVNPLLDKIPSDRYAVAEIPSNDTWARDHGGITVEINGINTILDFVFTGWGLKFPADKDNLITSKLHALGILHAPILPGGLALEGGGIESDGQGTLLTTSECLLSPNRNPHLNRSQTEDHLKSIFGVDRVLWLDNGYLAGDDTDSHIDTLARFINPDTIAYVRCNDPADEHYHALMLMEAELQNFRTANGTPYHLVPLPWPQTCLDPEDGHRLPATYANFLFINGAVLVPTYGVPQDNEALELFRKLCPDREVVGIDCRLLIRQHGSLHCITMQYPVGVV